MHKKRVCVCVSVYMKMPVSVDVITFFLSYLDNVR